MTRLFIEPEAEEELDEAAAGYEDAVPGLGEEFLAEMRQRVGNVLEMPLSFPMFGDADDVRCAHAVGRFPHLVIFMLAGDTVTLARVSPWRRARADCFTPPASSWRRNSSARASVFWIGAGCHTLSRDFSRFLASWKSITTSVTILPLQAPLGSPSPR